MNSRNWIESSAKENEMTYMLNELNSSSEEAKSLPVALGRYPKTYIKEKMSPQNMLESLPAGPIITQNIIISQKKIFSEFQGDTFEDRSPTGYGHNRQCQMLVTGPSTDANMASEDPGPEDIQIQSKVDEVWDIKVSQENGKTLINSDDSRDSTSSHHISWTGETKSSKRLIGQDKDMEVIHRLLSWAPLTGYNPPWSSPV
ncbi:hypothetical protein HGM15179_007867 [Zosterops borbonicus]|uniref:Uncharacterized protein n=1 Tax=Zosterops borbonicus TaxID=364589 RepID=A0A8K1GK59_9PASS|nr:hypothetical protein HGM15179_007867 [Zosterops borbonicus]